MCPWAPVTTCHLEPVGTGGLEAPFVPMGWGCMVEANQQQFFAKWLFLTHFRKDLRGFEFHKNELENCRVFLFEFFCFLN